MSWDEQASGEPRSERTTIETAAANDPAQAADETTVDVFTEALTDRSYQARYRRDHAIGHGGMGEVDAVNDRLIRRQVAMKTIRGPLASDDRARERFLREVRVQGRLQHPSIVPVYDLGLAPDGRMFFTMMRVRGETLADLLERQRSARDTLVGDSSRGRLLRAFASACLAVHYAHTEKVVHRDLKPANIMLGEFGEVYVLDWGVARVSESEAHASTAGLGSLTLDDVLGTPGYIAPEQLTGSSAEAGPAADIYSLGAILFEILTLRMLDIRLPAKPQFGIAGSAGSLGTLPPFMKVDQRLQDIVSRATQGSARHRFPSARALHDVLVDYLDTARSTEIRELARSRARRAVQMLDESDDMVSPQQRVNAAVHDLGRALALAPHDPEPREALDRLMRTPRAELPIPLRKGLDEVDERRAASLMRVAAVVHVALLLYIPIAILFGETNAIALASFSLMCGATVVAAYLAQAPIALRGVWLFGAVAGAMTCTLTVGTLGGPPELAPLLLAGEAALFCAHPNAGVGWTTLGLATLVALGSAAVGAAGLLGPEETGGATTVIVSAALTVCALWIAGLISARVSARVAATESRAVARDALLLQADQ